MPKNDARENLYAFLKKHDLEPDREPPTPLNPVWKWWMIGGAVIATLIWLACQVYSDTQAW